MTCSIPCAVTILPDVNRLAIDVTVNHFAIDVTVNHLAIDVTVNHLAIDVTVMLFMRACAPDRHEA